MKSVSNRKFTASRIAMTAFAAGVLGLVVVPAMSQLGGQGIFDIGIAKAQGQGSGQGGQGSGQGGEGTGQGGPSADSEGQGPKSQSGKPIEGKKGKPVWAQEGIPEVELGRLNVARAPAKVLDRQLAEAVSTITALSDEQKAVLVELYSGTVAQFITKISPTTWDSLVMVDSPLQNLALLRDLYDGSTFSLDTFGVDPYSSADLAAELIGVASDKTVPITRDTVVALNTLLDLGLTPDDITKIAADAEAVRIAVSLAHGE